MKSQISKIKIPEASLPLALAPPQAAVTPTRWLRAKAWLKQLTRSTHRDLDLETWRRLEYRNEWQEPRKAPNLHWHW